MSEGWGARWLGRHAIIAPFGVFVVTVLLTYLAGGGQWNGWESLKSAASMVDLGVVVYAMIAVTVEKGVDMVFWALEQRKKRIAERERLTEERVAQGQAEVVAALLAEGIPQTKEDLERWAQERGISLGNGLSSENVPPSEKENQ